MRSDGGYPASQSDSASSVTPALSLPATLPLPIPSHKRRTFFAFDSSMHEKLSPEISFPLLQLDAVPKSTKYGHSSSKRTQRVTDDTRSG